MNLNDITAKSLINATMDHPKTSVIVPFFTSLVGVATIQNWLTIISMILGIFAAAILVRHRWVILQTAEIELAEARRRLQEMKELDDANQ